MYNNDLIRQKYYGIIIISTNLGLDKDAKLCAAVQKNDQPFQYNCVLSIQSSSDAYKVPSQKFPQKKKKKYLPKLVQGEQSNHREYKQLWL